MRQAESPGLRRRKEPGRVPSDTGPRRGRLCYVLQTYQEDSTDCSPHVYRFLEELSTVVDLFVVVERCQGPLNLRGVKRGYCQRWRNRILRLLEIVSVLLWARLLGYRRFYVRYSQSAMLAAPLLRLLGARVYYWNCGMMKEFFRPWSLRWQDWRFKLMVEFPLRFSLKAASYVVTGTDSMADYYARHFGLRPSRVLVVPNDVDVGEFLQGAGPRSQTPEQESVVLYVGRLDKANGADHLPPIAESVCHRISNARFIIVGEGSLQDWLRQEIQARDIASRVTLVGPVPNSEVARFYARAGVFVLPAMAEGMPRVLLESMAAGVPFVATAVGGVPDLVTAAQRRWLTEPNDLEGFADRVVELLTHPEIREQLRGEGRRRVQDFSRERVCEIFVDRILGESRAGFAAKAAGVTGP